MSMTMYTEDIIELNRDVEPFIIQGAATRTAFFRNKPEKYPDPYKVLQFVHCSDMHAVPDLWDRMVQYINHYSAYIAFAVHTGDYCGGSQEAYTDFYSACTRCVHPIYNCVGNHDTVNANGPSSKKTAHDLLFNHKADWEAVFCPVDNAMSYYKDFPESNIRLIVLDLYYDTWPARPWLLAVLEDAL
ncbi:MAG: metallophosphoesterase, partial [Clostridia bacterium]|nr:metallophosphoesterase [Clostridia bacterium]